MSGQRVLITAAHAFIPGQLNLTHAAGTYLPADIHARLSTLFGAAPRFVTGIDVRGRLAARELRARWSSPAAMNDFYADRFAAGLRKLGIVPEEFLRTDDERVATIVAYTLRNLLAAGRLCRKQSHRYRCQSCLEDLAKSEVCVSLTEGAELVNLKSLDQDSVPATAPLACTRCGGRVTKTVGEPWFLTLPRDDGLKALHQRQPFPVLRKSLEVIFANNFAEWEITRDNYYGLPMPLDPSTSLYIWYESLAAKFAGLSAAPEDLGNVLSDMRMVTFFGKNVVQYYGLVLPTLMRWGLGVDSPDIVLSGRGFCDPNRSDATLIDIEQTLSSFPRDVVRFYCAYAAPDDVVDFSLRRDHLEATAHGVLRRTFGRYLRAAATCLASANLPASALWSAPEPPERDRIAALHRMACVRRILLELETYVRHETARVEQSQPGQIAPIACRGFALVYDVLACFIPEMIQSFRLFDVDERGFLVPSPVRPAPVADPSWGSVSHSGMAS